MDPLPEPHQHALPPAPTRLALPPSPTHHRWFWAITLLLVVVAMVFGWRFYKERATPAAGAAKNAQVPVVADVARKGDIGVYFTGLGTVTPLHTVTVKTRVDGQLMSVYYTEGQRVQKGAPLVEIDPRPIRCSSDRRKASSIKDQGGPAERADRPRTLIRRSSSTTPSRSRCCRRRRPRSRVGPGAIKTDQANIDSANLNISHAYHRTDRRPRRSALVDPWQHGVGQRRHAARRHRRSPADQRDLLRFPNSRWPTCARSSPPVIT